MTSDAIFGIGNEVIMVHGARARAKFIEKEMHQVGERESERARVIK